jgi:hypothetical protein
MKKLFAAVRGLFEFIRDLCVDGYGAVAYSAPILSIAFTMAKFFEVSLYEIKNISYAWGLLPICIWFFVGYARRRAMSDRSRKIRKLKEFYSAADTILNAKLSKETADSVFDTYVQSANSWASEGANWINNQMGPLATSRFLDKSNLQAVSISGAINERHNTILTNISRLKSNLKAMIENPSWDQD